MRLAWLTDVHLNFLDAEARADFYAAVAGQRPDVLVISGDIAESPSIESVMLEMATAWDRPIYFVLGNHDFYRGSVAQTRARMEQLVAGRPQLTYLSQSPLVPLSARTALVGHDGWADGRYGDFDHSTVILNDFLLIDELCHWETRFDLDRPRLRAALQTLAGEATDHVRRTLSQAAARFEQVIVATHVPPFREACLYQGRISNDKWLPHFASQAMGEALCEVAKQYPACQILVLCGHTHTAGDVQILPNLHVLAGAAQYKFPQVQRILEIA